ncbi:MAG TPA: glycine betaine ABC transporter substrate-binding protein [Solirubrobacterales bacterium]|nr:glycine betaine ABC transporter substrate-binding protein [Solirubrobacterales bacterium]
MSSTKLKYLLVLSICAMLAFGLAACGSDDSDDGDSGSGNSSSAELIQSNPDNESVDLTIGSKNFTEQIVLGEIYAQGLEAAGYSVDTDLNLGSETIALAALKKGEISGYPEYVSTALTSFYDAAPEDVPADAQEAFTKVQADLKKDGLVAFPPTPFASANAVGLLTSKAEELGVTKISDLEGKSQDLTLYGSPECRQRIDCLVGLNENYGLEFKSFTPVDIGLRYEVLDKGQADLSILFTTDAQLGASDKYTILEDDKGVLPAGNVVFLTEQKTIDEAGPDYQATIEKVQSGLTEKVMQELDARVDIDKEDPAAVAADYLKASGYTE